ncbi:RNA polymerase sigma-70 factor, ECF subfamily [Pedobacter steynii]|uniref:RNA polymerase sigma-70 factor, ECF subfamily n=1 Tax=Pedobacter steynii TaxID=430522 RepID=A0A1G9K7S5_9SPHI|nr:RNA polymerase sigma-70 factor [Pedobacter steynii]NQX38474.1 RNA polymerase sigma-70 factor [Pedobacter steynii]SDL45798.1 RNA polymerase sigma-70 factor, ECF subfamily [Pedobacter steynii]
MSPYNQESETQLLVLVREGDHAAFNEVYNRLYRALFGYAYHMIDDKFVCDDMVQDVFSWFWEHRAYHQINNLKSYLLAAIKYQAAKYIRRGMIRENHVLASLNTTSFTINDESLEFKELQAVINSSIHQLPEKCKEIFRMSREEQLSNREIAAKLGISEGTVAVQIKRALGKLRENLGNMHFWMYFFL